MWSFVNGPRSHASDRSLAKHVNLKWGVLAILHGSTVLVPLLQHQQSPIISCGDFARAAVSCLHLVSGVCSVLHHSVFRLLPFQEASHAVCFLFNAVDKRIPAQVTGDQHQTLWADQDGQRYPGKSPVCLCWQKLWFKEFVCVVLWAGCVLCHRQSGSPPQKIITCTVYT